MYTILSSLFSLVSGSKAVPTGMTAYLSVDKCGLPEWQEFRTVLDQATTLYESKKYADSVSLLTSLLQATFSDVFVAFECGTGMAAATHLLADNYEALGLPVKTLRARQATSVYAAFDYQMKGEEWISKSGWRITWDGNIQSVLRAMSAYQEVDGALGKSRTSSVKDSLSALKVPRFQKEDARYAIVSVCDYDANVTPLAILSKTNKDWYAKKHGYDLFVYEKAPFFQDPFTAKSGLDAQRPPAWSKIDAMLEIVGTGEYDWVMWMDCDSYFLDPEVSFSELLTLAIKERGSEKTELKTTAEERAAVKRLRHWKPRNSKASLQDLSTEFDSLLANELGGNLDFMDERRIMMVASEDGLMLNTGIFWMKTTPWTYGFLQNVRRSFTFNNNPINWHSWWEQTALVYLISISKTILEGAEISRDFDFDQDNFGNIPAVHYLTQKHINGYPPIVSMMLKTHVPFDQGDYIVSFSGCKIFNSQEMCNMLFLTYFCTIRELCDNLPIDKSKYFPY
jgi:hypothetical protein